MAIRSNFPSIKPSLLLDFANTKALDPRITFTRATTATYYDGLTTAKAEENLLIRSQEFENGAGWVTVSATVTTNNSVAPDGTTTADTITASSGTGLFPRVSVATVSSTASVSHTASIYAKAGTHRYLQLTSAAGTPWHCNFDLLAGSGAVGSSSGCTGSIVDAGNGWYRCVVVFTPSTTDARVIFILVDSASAARTATWNPAGTETVLLWGAQLEQRSAVTAYTPTTTQPITNYIPVLQTAASGVPRFDHNPITDESLGLLIEEQRTNLVLRSEEFDNAYWTKNASVSVSANAAVSPDGNITADQVSITGTGLTTQLYRTVTVTSGVATTISLYVKYYSGANGDFLFSMGSDTTRGIRVTVNSTSLTISEAGANVVSSGFQAVGNGWFRVFLVVNSTSTSFEFNIFRPVAYGGTGANVFLFWGAQLEAGAFATSYIPTVASQVTRSAEVASMTGTNFSSWYRTDEGTLYAEMIPLRVSSTQSFGVFTLDDNTGTNKIGLNQSNGACVLNIASANSGAGAISPNVIPAGALGKFAGSYSDFNYAACLNAGTIGTSTALKLPIVNRAFVGFSQRTGLYANGTIRKIAYYPIRVTNAQLQGLTTV